MARDLNGQTIPPDRVNAAQTVLLGTDLQGEGGRLRKRYFVLCEGRCGTQLGWLDYDFEVVGYDAERSGLFCATCVPGEEA
jgi:hypothetical protein